MWRHHKCLKQLFYADHFFVKAFCCPISIAIAQFSSDTVPATANSLSVSCLCRLDAIFAGGSKYITRSLLQRNYVTNPCRLQPPSNGENSNIHHCCKRDNLLLENLCYIPQLNKRTTVFVHCSPGIWNVILSRIKANYVIGLLKTTMCTSRKLFHRSKWDVTNL